MTAIATHTAAEKIPDDWWLSPNYESRGMDVLVDNYTPKKYPIVAFGGTFLAIKQDGGTSWGSGVPKALDDKLRGRQMTLPKVNLVCLGTDKNSYFVQFEDFTSEWEVQDDFLSGFIKGSPHIRVLALGSNDGYYCQNSEGREIHSRLPKGLDDALTGRKNSLPKVQNVNLGANGEWFVRFMDGTWSCGGHTTKCDETLDEIDDGGTVHEVLFGMHHTWMIRYDEYACGSLASLHPFFSKRN